MLNYYFFVMLNYSESFSKRAELMFFFAYYIFLQKVVNPM